MTNMMNVLSEQKLLKLRLFFFLNGLIRVMCGALGGINLSGFSQFPHIFCDISLCRECTNKYELGL